MFHGSKTGPPGTSVETPWYFALSASTQHLTGPTGHRSLFVGGGTPTLSGYTFTDLYVLKLRVKDDEVRLRSMGGKTKGS